MFGNIMKTSYLSNKIKNKNYLSDGFPTRPNYNEIIDFLTKQQNFKLIEYDSAHSTLINVIYDVERAAKKSTTPLLYVTDEDFSNASNKKHTWIRFCNYGKISDDNPIFLLRLFRDDDSRCPKIANIGVGTIEISLDERIEIDTYEEFVKIANKQFGWE